MAENMIGAIYGIAGACSLMALIAVTLAGISPDHAEILRDSYLRESDEWSVTVSEDFRLPDDKMGTTPKKQIIVALRDGGRDKRAARSTAQVALLIAGVFCFIGAARECRIPNPDA